MNYVIKLKNCKFTKVFSKYADKCQKDLTMKIIPFLKKTETQSNVFSICEKRMPPSLQKHLELITEIEKNSQPDNLVSLFTIPKIEAKILNFEIKHQVLSIQNYKDKKGI